MQRSTRRGGDGEPRIARRLPLPATGDGRSGRSPYPARAPSRCTLEGLFMDARGQVELVQRAELARGRAAQLRFQLRASKARLAWEVDRLKSAARRFPQPAAR